MQKPNSVTIKIELTEKQVLDIRMILIFKKQRFYFGEEKKLPKNHAQILLKIRKALLNNEFPTIMELSNLKIRYLANCIRNCYSEFACKPGIGFNDELKSVSHLVEIIKRELKDQPNLSKKLFDGWFDNDQKFDFQNIRVN